MGLVVIIIFLLMVIGVYRQKNSIDDEQAYSIRFDLRYKRFIKGLALFFSGISFFLILICVLSFTNVISHDNGLLFAVPMISFLIVFATIYLWSYYAEICMYIKKLGYLGFDIPEDKRDYDNLLINLSRYEDRINIPETDTGMKVLKYAARVIQVIFILVGVLFAYEWYFIIDQIGFFLFCYLVVVGVWELIARYVNKNADNHSYTDFGCIEAGKKLRISFSGWATGMIILLAIFGFLSTIPFTMTEYVCKTKEASDIHYIESTLLYFARDKSYSNSKYSEDRVFEPVKFSNLDEMTLDVLIASEEYMSDIKSSDPVIEVWYSDNEINARYTYRWKYGRLKERNFNIEIKNEF